MRIRTAITATLLLASLVACGGRPDTTDAKAEPTPSPSPARVYDVHDCRALLERNYEGDASRDASADPECTHLTHDQYVEVVEEVLDGHTDEILAEAADHTMWDEAWDTTDPEQQQVVCDRALADGSVVVGQEMIDAGTDPDGNGGNPIDMVQYYLDEKC